MTEKIKEFELTLKLRNNLIKQRRVELGFSTVAAFSKHVGIAQGVLGQMENLKYDPVNRYRMTFKPAAVRLAEFFGMSPNEIWPESILAVKQPESARGVSFDEIAPMLAASAEPAALLEESVSDRDLADFLKSRADEVLKPREKEVLRMWMDDKDLVQIARVFDLGRERTRQILETAFSKIRHDYAVVREMKRLEQ